MVCVSGLTHGIMGMIVPRHHMCSGMQRPATGNLCGVVFPKADKVIGSCVCSFMVQACGVSIAICCRVQQRLVHLLNSIPCTPYVM